VNLRLALTSLALPCMKLWPKHRVVMAYHHIKQGCTLATPEIRI
jgi:hypothetical protein